MRSWFALFALILLCAGCGARTGVRPAGLDAGGPAARIDVGAPMPTDAGPAPAPPDAGPPPPCVEVQVPGADAGVVPRVDLLFLIDNSGSMGELQKSLADQLGGLVQAVTSGDPTPGLPGDEFGPVRDLHIGVVSSDLGSAGFNVRTCASTFGDDGLFSLPVTARQRQLDEPSCEDRPLFLSYAPGADRRRFERESRCLVALGSRGCGFEQQLEAPLLALWPPLGIASDPPSGRASPAAEPFLGSRPGHGQSENAGFLRPDSVLVIVLLTDEDDCSVRDPNVFDESNPEFGTVDLNVRCAPATVGGFQERVAFPVERYVRGYLALRNGDASRLVFGAITGVPPDSPAIVRSPSNPNGGQGTANLDAVLADPRMREVVDESDPSWTCAVEGDCAVFGRALRCLGGRCAPRVPALRPACTVPGRGSATPARRIVGVARGLGLAGARSVVQSICQEDFRPAIGALLGEVGTAVRTVCVPLR